MTNKELASILEMMVNNFVMPRGCGSNLEALLKVIEVLNNAPDKEEL